MSVAKLATKKEVTIKAPDIRTAEFTVVGTAPYVQSRFSEKAKNMMREKMAQGSVAKKGRARAARDFEADYNASYYQSAQGWFGIPANAFRSSMIRACSLVGFAMTQARMSCFIVADGYDKDGTTPVRVRYDADQFTLDDVANLLARAGLQVGVGEGRPMSRGKRRLRLGHFRAGAIAHAVWRARHGQLWFGKFRHGRRG